MTDTRRQILDSIVYQLRGTCNFLEDVAESNGIDELTIEDLQYIEGWIFLCDNCGWWYDRGEEVLSNLCRDCYDEEQAAFYGEDDEDD